MPAFAQTSPISSHSKRMWSIIFLVLLCTLRCQSMPKRKMTQGDGSTDDDEAEDRKDESYFALVYGQEQVASSVLSGASGSAGPTPQELCAAQEMVEVASNNNNE